MGLRPESRRLDRSTSRPASSSVQRDEVLTAPVGSPWRVRDPHLSQLQRPCSDAKTRAAPELLMAVSASS